MLFLSLKEYPHKKIEADGLELRLDLFSKWDLKELSAFRNKCKKRLIFTLRKKKHGGLFPSSETQRLYLLEKLADLEPDYLDIESDTPSFFLENLVKKHPKLKIILSYHNFKETPEDLFSLIEKMRSPFAFSYKIATKARCICDSLRLLLFIKRCPERLSGICLGPLGQITRILGPVFGSFIDYTFEGVATGEGQLSLEELKKYHYFSLNNQTRLFGLIGNPVDKSLSDYTHNALFRKEKLNAVYVKMPVEKDKLFHFLLLAKDCGFEGLSVTTPLKSLAFTLCKTRSQKDSAIHAVNTLKWQRGCLYGCNMDGKGALLALKEKSAISGKRMALLGAGSTARAIAFEMKREKVKLTLFNRTIRKARILAEELQCEYKKLKDFQKEDFDIIINATSCNLPLAKHVLPKNKMVFDVQINPLWNPFLRSCQKKGCLVIYGYEMFLQQAALQFAFWFKKNIDKEYLKEKCLESLHLKLGDKS